MSDLLRPHLKKVLVGTVQCTVCVCTPFPILMPVLQQVFCLSYSMCATEVCLGKLSLHAYPDEGLGAIGHGFGIGWHNALDTFPFDISILNLGREEEEENVSCKCNHPGKIPQGGYKRFQCQFPPKTSYISLVNILRNSSQTPILNTGQQVGHFRSIDCQHT